MNSVGIYTTVKKKKKEREREKQLVFAVDGRKDA